MMLRNSTLECQWCHKMLSGYLRSIAFIQALDELRPQRLTKESYIDSAIAQKAILALSHLHSWPLTTQTLSQGESRSRRVRVPNFSKNSFSVCENVDMCPPRFHSHVLHAMHRWHTRFMVCCSCDSCKTDAWSSSFQLDQQLTWTRTQFEHCFRELVQWHIAVQRKREFLTSRLSVLTELIRETESVFCQQRPDNCKTSSHEDTNEVLKDAWLSVWSLSHRQLHNTSSTSLLLVIGQK